MKRGPKPKGKVKIIWSPQFAYAIGLLTADGCLSKDGRHIDLTSKDKAQILLFKKCLGLSVKVGNKYSSNGNLAYHAQFGDVLFYKFLMSIGLTPAKSKTIGVIKIPEIYRSAKNLLHYSQKYYSNSLIFSLLFLYNFKKLESSTME